MIMPILEVSSLSKKFGAKTAVNNLSFSINKGQVVGLLGANGAGKTTTIQMLTGTTTPTSGVIKYFGNDFALNKSHCLARINYASAYNMLQGRISVWENLKVYAYLYNIKNYHKKITELADYFAVTDYLHKRLWYLSAGQKTRVNLVKAFLNDPEIILMDEPTASLDPDIADKTIQLIEKFTKQKNLAILYTSHNMDEVTRLCDEVIFLEKGSLVAKDTPIGLTKKIKKATMTIVFDGKTETVTRTLNDVKCKFEFRKQNHIFISDIDESIIPKVIFKLSNNNIWITDIEIKKPDLADVFLQITRKGSL